jgi:tripartite-type tricarboxylate transporter receptor subunit TctC
VFSGSYLGRPVMTTPGVPAERVRALRDAFAATMKDPDFIAASNQSKFELAPIRGEDMQKVVERVLATPAPLVARARKIME